jgi:hypothetical protein
MRLADAMDVPGGTSFAASIPATLPLKNADQNCRPALQLR